MVCRAVPQPRLSSEASLQTIILTATVFRGSVFCAGVLQAVCPLILLALGMEEVLKPEG